MMTQVKTIMLAALLSATFSAPLAYAAASGGSSEPAAGEEPLTKKQVAAKTQCKKDGDVWNMKKRICEKAQSGSLDDESLYNAGREFALDGRYDEAITTLNYVANAQDKRVLNYLGYSYRKSGHVDVGLTYYKQALAIEAARSHRRRRHQRPDPGLRPGYAAGQPALFSALRRGPGGATGDTASLPEGP